MGRRCSRRVYEQPRCRARCRASRSCWPRRTTRANRTSVARTVGTMDRGEGGPKDRANATNVRELGRSPRRDDSIRMIARILSSFSLVSLVEVRRDTRDLERVLAALGERWRALYSDPLEDPGANEERACFLFDLSLIHI